MDLAGKSQGNSGGRNSKGIPPYGRTDNGGNMTVVIVDIYRQGLVELPVTSEKTVWITSGVKPSIYFYKFDPARAGEGELMSGKVVVQK